MTYIVPQYWIRLELRLYRCGAGLIRSLGAGFDCAGGVVYWRAGALAAGRENAVRTMRICLLVGLIVLVGCAPAGDNVPAPQASRPYTHPSGVFALDLPPTWLVGDLSSGPVLHVTFAPPDAPRPLLTVYAFRMETALDDDVFGATMGGFLRAPLNHTIDIIETTAMGDGSWRATAVRNIQGESLPVNIFMQRDGPVFSAIEVTVPGNDAFTMALLSLMTNSFSVDSTVEWPVATLVDLPGGDPNLVLAAGNLSFSSLLTWTDAGDTFHITGQVANRAPYALEAVVVTAQLLDGAGNVLEESSAAVPVDVLLDGELAPFDVQFGQGWPRVAVRYALTAEADPAGAILTTLYGPESFDWEDRAEYDEAGQLHIRGTVWNAGTLTTRDVQAVVTVFDGADRVAGVIAAPVGSGPLAPGESVRFDVPLATLGGDPIRYQLVVQGVQ